jgi:hypothetical protein
MLMMVFHSKPVLLLFFFRVTLTGLLLIFIVASDDEGQFEGDEELDELDDNINNNNGGGGSVVDEELRRTNFTRWPANSHMAEMFRQLFNPAHRLVPLLTLKDAPPIQHDIWYLCGAILPPRYVVPSPTPTSTSSTTTPNDSKNEKKAIATTALLGVANYGDGHGHDGRPTLHMMRVITQFALRVAENLRPQTAWSVIVHYWRDYWKPFLLSMTDTVNSHYTQ